MAGALGAPFGTDTASSPSVDGLLRCKWLLGLRQSDRAVEFIVYVAEPTWRLGGETEAFASGLILLDIAGEPGDDLGVGRRSVLVTKPGDTNVRHRVVVELDDGRVLALQGGDDAIEGREPRAVFSALVLDLLVPALVRGR